MRNHPPARTVADLPDRDIEIGCLQLDWLHARAAKVYFELLVERYNPHPNCFDWSLNLSREQCKSLKRYQKGRRKPPIPYQKIRATRRHHAQLPRALPPHARAASTAIS
jgi:hypothetical protein